MNRKGFSLIEILGVITIMGILSVIGVIAYTRYQQKAIKQAHENNSKNAYHAAENYFQDNAGETTITFAKLKEELYLDSIPDPKDKNQQCTGKIIRTKTNNQTGDSLESYKFQVHIKCIGHESCTEYPSNTNCTFSNSGLA